MTREIEFVSHGVTLRGLLDLPRAATSPPPIVIMAHGFSATIDGMVAERYAEVFRGAGLATLLFDHRGFGRSGGEPRQRIDHWLQVIGYRDAIDFVSTLTDVDGSRPALWGDSLSGGCVIVVAAFDARVAAVITQVPACGDTPPPSDDDGAIVRAMRRLFSSAELCADPDVEGPMPVVSADQMHAPSALTPLSAFRWFMAYGAMHGTSWQNWITVAQRAAEPYHPVLCAGHVHAPALFVVAADDEMPGANAAISRLAFGRAAGPKELLEIGGGHFGLLYHPGDLFDRASRAERDFLARHLLAAPGPAEG